MTHIGNYSGGIGLPAALFLVFLVLKLTDKIDWSWWWVTCPLWALPVIFLSVAFVLMAVGMSVEFFRSRR